MNKLHTEKETMKKEAPQAETAEDAKSARMAGETENQTDSTNQPSSEAKESLNSEQIDDSSVKQDAPEFADLDNAVDQLSAAMGMNQSPEQTELEEGEALPEIKTMQHQIDQLKNELMAAKSLVAKNNDMFLRTKAELDNFQKRSEREVERARKIGLERFLQEMLPIKDGLEMGLNAAGDENIDPVRLKEGTEITLKMLQQAFEKFAVQEIDPINEKFDPDLHEAMTMQEVEGKDSGIVVTVIQKGYRIDNRLVRPARVIVSK